MKKIVFILCFLMMNIMSFAFFRTSVAPGVFDISLDRPTTEEIILINNSDSPIKVKIYTGKDGDMTDSEYLGDWVRIYPRNMTLQGREERRIKFSVKSPKDTRDGEYRGLIFIEELPEVVEGKNTLTLAGRHGLTVYGTKGKLTYDVAVSKISMDKKEGKNMLDVTLVNKGEYSVKPEISVKYLNAKGKVLAEDKITGGRVRKNTSKDITVELKNLQGNSMEIVIKAKDTVIYKTNINLK